MENPTHHIHLPDCPSTQLFLKENITELRKQSNNILVSTDHQAQGLGRQGNNWDHHSNSLAFSFTLEPLPVLTLTPLELGIHLVQFFHEEYGASLKLKWPNDLLTHDGKKCGGILCHNSGDDLIIAGIGINLGQASVQNQNYKTPFGQVMPQYQMQEGDTKSIPAKIYQYILSKRQNKINVQELWKKYCFHQDHEVQIEDDGRIQRGVFKGIGQDGEALIKQDEKLLSLYSGSLYLI